MVINDNKVPVYQPGTVMMESAISASGKCAVEHGGSQQNGPILGNGCACFLAKVLASISKDGIDCIMDLAVEDAT